MGIQVPGGKDNPFSGGVSVNSTTNMGLVGAPKTQFNQFDLIQKTSGQALEAVNHYQDEIDRTRVQDSINQMKIFENDLDNNPDTGWKARTGSQALEPINGKSLHDDVLQRMKDKSDEIRKGLNNRQRRAFDDYYQKASFAKSLALNEHMLKATKTHRSDVVNSSFTLAVNDMQSGELSRMHSGVVVAVSSLQEVSEMTGKAISIPEKLGSSLYAGVGTLADSGQLDEAKDWAEQYRSYMGEANYHKSLKVIKTAQEKAQVKDAVEAIIGQHPEDSLAGRRALRDYPEELRPKINQKLREYYGMVDAERRQHDREVSDMAYKMVAAGEEVPASLWEELPGRTQLALERMQQTRANRFEAEKARIEKERLKDPIGVAIEQQEGGVSPISQWTPQGVGEELAKRVANPELEKKGSHTPSPVISNREMEDLTGRLGQMTAQDQFTLLNTLYEGARLTPEALPRLIQQFKDAKAQSYGSALYLMANNPSIAQKYLQGKEYLRQSRVKESAIEQIATVKAQIYTQLGNDADNEGVTRDTEALHLLMDASLGVWAADSVDGSGRVDEAVKAVVGGIGKLNGRKFILPKVNGETLKQNGWVGDSFEDRLEKKQKALAKSQEVVFFGGQKLPLGAIASRLKTFQFETVGNGQYALVNDGKYVLQAEGKNKGQPYILDVLQ